MSTFGNPEIEDAYRDWFATINLGTPKKNQDIARGVLAVLDHAKLFSEEKVHRTPQHRYYNQEPALLVEFLFRALIEFDAINPDPNFDGRTPDETMSLLIAALDWPRADRHRGDPHAYAKWVDDKTFAIYPEAHDAIDYLLYRYEDDLFTHPVAELVLRFAERQSDFRSDFAKQANAHHGIPYKLIPVGNRDSYALIQTSPDESTP